MEPAYRRARDTLHRHNRDVHHEVFYAVVTLGAAAASFLRR
jgi:hypothetical protein